MNKKFTKEDLVKTGEEINNLCRAFNIREGITKKDDHLPKWFITEPIKKGAYDGKTVSEQDFEKMLDEYYRLRRWDKNGKPPS